MGTVNDCFFIFSIITKHTERQRLSQRIHKNRHFKRVCFNFVFCEMFLKIIVLKKTIKKQQLYIIKDTNFQFLLPPTYNTANFSFFIFVAIAIAVFCVQLVNQLFLYIYNKVSGAFSGIAYFFNNSICDLVLLFRKNSLWASILLFTNQNVLVFTYKQTRSPRKNF